MLLELMVVSCVLVGVWVLIGISFCWLFSMLIWMFFVVLFFVLIVRWLFD